MNLSVSHYICGEDIPFLDFIRNVSDAGITSVGITCQAIEEMGLHDLRSCLNDYGVSVSSLNSAGYFTHSAYRPNKYSDEELVEYSAYLNSDILCVPAICTFFLRFLNFIELLSGHWKTTGQLFTDL